MEEFLMFPRCYSQPQLFTGWSKDGHKLVPIVFPVQNLPLGSCSEAVMSTGALGPSWAPRAVLYTRFLCAQ